MVELVMNREKSSLVYCLAENPQLKGFTSREFRLPDYNLQNTFSIISILRWKRYRLRMGARRNNEERTAKRNMETLDSKEAENIWNAIVN